MLESLYQEIEAKCHDRGDMLYARAFLQEYATRIVNEPPRDVLIELLTYNGCNKGDVSRITAAEVLLKYAQFLSVITEEAFMELLSWSTLWKPFGPAHSKSRLLEVFNRVHKKDVDVTPKSGPQNG